MKPGSPAAGSGERKLLESAEVLPSIRDLIVQLHRSNGPEAENIATDVAAYLKQVIQSEGDPLDLQRAQQTMFAVEEVRMLLAERDFGAASTAARDAAKEWKQPGKID